VAYGNFCTWSGCGLNSTTNAHFGGCSNDPTAGTLSCADQTRAASPHLGRPRAALDLRGGGRRRSGAMVMTKSTLTLGMWLVLCACSSRAATSASGSGAQSNGGSHSSTGTTSDGSATSGSSATGGGSTSTAGTGGAGTLFFDDFSGPKLGTAWVALDRHGDYGNNEEQCYSPSAVGVTGGNLVITTTAQPTSCGDATHAPSTSPYLSGMVQWQTFDFTYGTVEIRARMAGGQGTWPALWLLGANCQATNIATADNMGACQWPNPGSDEIDITEILGSNHTAVNEQVHTTSSNDGCSAPATDVSQSFHVYTIEWKPGSLIWKIDGAQTCNVTNGVPSTPMFLMMNTAMGGAGGTVDDSTLPATMEVDYVKVTN
jgi:beta-glucanase (GH16 family)